MDGKDSYGKDISALLSVGTFTAALTTISKQQYLEGNPYPAYLTATNSPLLTYMAVIGYDEIDHPTNGTDQPMDEEAYTDIDAELAEGEQIRDEEEVEQRLLELHEEVDIEYSNQEYELTN